MCVQVYCLPRDAPKTDQLWLNMRDTRHCAHLIKPPAEEECARHPCPSFWQETGWANCTAVGPEQNSVYCQGSRHLSYHCPATRQHLCGPRPPPHVASCHAEVVATKLDFLGFIYQKPKCFSIGVKGIIFITVRDVRNPSVLQTSLSYVPTRFLVLKIPLSY